jgi:phosphoribosylformylglycinamidine cyclo-ligase
MCVDDIVCIGAEPLFLLDYISTGVLEPARMEQLVTGVAEGCRQARCALLGGEMAEHGAAMAPGQFDLAGFAVGVVDAAHKLGPDRVKAGDSLVGLASPGLRSNGYSLARHVLLERAGRPLAEAAWDGATRTLGEELLLPSVIYAPAVLAVGAAVPHGALRAAAHVTGGGIPGNLSRVLAPGTGAVVETWRWEEPRIFGEIRRLGHIDEEEMGAVFNLGVGMILVLDPRHAGTAVDTLTAAGVQAVEIGRVVEGAGVRLARR